MSENVVRKVSLRFDAWAIYNLLLDAKEAEKSLKETILFRSNIFAEGSPLKDKVISMDVVIPKFILDIEEMYKDLSLEEMKGKEVEILERLDHGIAGL